MAENLPRYAVTDLIARVSGMSRGRLEMRLLGECAEVSRFMPPQTAGEGDMAFLTNAAYAEAMKASRASLLIMREQECRGALRFGRTRPRRARLRQSVRLLCIRLPDSLPRRNACGHSSARLR
ncbi:MAG: LpxD N-terminal domain-containing protein [Sutterella wadsworthensis]